MACLRLVTTVTGANPNLRDLYLDDSGQLEWIGLDVTDTEDYAIEVAQAVEARLQTIRGEWYQDQRIGLPWIERILRKGTTSDELEEIFKAAISATPGVRSVDSIEVELDSQARTATIAFVLTTETNRVVSSDQLDDPFVMQLPTTEAT